MLIVGVKISMAKKNVLNVQIIHIVQILQKLIVFLINVNHVWDLSPLSVNKMIINQSAPVQPK